MSKSKSKPTPTGALLPTRSGNCRAHTLRERIAAGAVAAAPPGAAILPPPASPCAQSAPGEPTAFKVNAVVAAPFVKPAGAAAKLDLRKYTLVRAADLPDFSA